MQTITATDNDLVSTSAMPGDLRQLLGSIDRADLGARMHSLIRDLYPICRSITGDGFRQTLARISEEIPLATYEIPTGTQVFDWTIPREWNIRDAWVKNSRGEKVIDFSQSSLHVVNYSTPLHRQLSLTELRPHLHTLPNHPQWIPYRTSYYQENWGFCLTHERLQQLEEGQYEVFIDSDLQPGSLTYGECFLPGRRPDEILLSCHACHPSLCNDNLSGVALVCELAKLLSTADREYSYRFLFIPGTIGSIAWLSQHRAETTRIRHGLVVACVGDEGKFHYKQSRRGDAEIDCAAAHALHHSGEEFEICPFTPFGYDERQYCSPGFNMPVGSLTRTPHGRFPEYHTSADNLDFVTPAALAGSLVRYLSVLLILERNGRFQNLCPYGEPQLGKRGLYRSLGGFPDAGRLELAMLWVLNLSDSQHTLLEIAEQADLPFELIDQAARALLAHELLAYCT